MNVYTYVYVDIIFSGFTVIPKVLFEYAFRTIFKSQMFKGYKINDTNTSRAHIQNVLVPITSLVCYDMPLSNHFISGPL